MDPLVLRSSTKEEASEEDEDVQDISWEEHMRRIKSGRVRNSIVEDEDPSDREAVANAILAERRREQHRSDKMHAKKRVQENSARSKDFGLQMLTIHERPNKDFVTLRLQAETFIRAIITIQKWVRGCLVRRLVRQIHDENERQRKIKDAGEISTGGGWKEARDRDGCPYFWNRISGCTTYVEPEIYENLAGLVVETVKRSGNVRRFSQFASQWGTALSEDGRRYYFDKVTGSRSWTRPPGWGTHGLVSPAQQRLQNVQDKNAALREQIREMQEEVRRLQTGMLDLPTLEDAVASM
eukprot:g2113.t1